MTSYQEPTERVPTQTRRERRVDRSSWTPRLGPGMLLGALGTLGVVISMFLEWRTDSVHPSDIPFAFLWNHTTTSQNPSLLIALIPLAIIMAVGAFVPRGGGARIFGGLGVLVVAGLFVYQLSRVTDDVGGSVSDALETGFYFAAIGGLVGLVSGFLPSGWARRRTVETAVDDGYSQR
jgi:hypothetical protein